MNQQKIIEIEFLIPDSRHTLNLSQKYTSKQVENNIRWNRLRNIASIIQIEYFH